MRRQIAIGAAAFAVVSTIGARGATAQSHETVTNVGPNRPLLSSGLFFFGVPYVASLITAGISDHPRDKNLYVPVVGPWIDLGDRGMCGGLGQTTCNAEASYKFLLVTDGIAQGVGALQIVGGLLFPEAREGATGARIAFSPSHMGPSGYGVAAVGRF